MKLSLLVLIGGVILCDAVSDSDKARGVVHNARLRVASYLRGNNGLKFATLDPDVCRRIYGDCRFNEVGQEACEKMYQYCLSLTDDGSEEEGEDDEVEKHFVKFGDGACLDEDGSLFPLVEINDINDVDECKAKCVSINDSKGMVGLGYNEELKACFCDFEDGTIPSPCPSPDYFCHYDLDGHGAVRGLETGFNRVCYKYEDDEGDDEGGDEDDEEDDEDEDEDIPISSPNSF
mmetsp:Transcript_41577/g.87255  ORF Transcript_41577/g.87255 Transcript_41577/m.87255 type:complete len:233 (+) Transcript_41577:247-945(+)|eukprot:CAMPEP_0183730738 /NCGR_PEP_ID=MMETSP0737-20130205/33594_1 /TAXON_ID=385413 /ORGANISM="Thalassiosira miniscula, Strain CCMP1093" /LENGTH=232 /DNA_ID=CAMNT_0025963313 /DNA_START=233 /DNA_END=931 /DNA_ORIENTATION=-